MKNAKVNLCFAFVAMICLGLFVSACQPGDKCQDAFPQGISYDNVNDQNVIIDGYDVVAFFTDRKPVLGLPDYQTTYEGTVYHFKNEQNLMTFQSNPEKYRPQYGGWCAVAASRNHIQVISVDYFEILNDRLYLNHNATAKRIWDNGPPQQIVKLGDIYWPCLLKEHGAAFAQDRPITTN